MKVLTNAKVNIDLKILGSASNGYHLLESTFLPFPIFDELEIDFSEKFSFEGVFPETNICIKAKKIFCQIAKIDKEVSIKLTKKVPIGGGLGGASSNAAGVILGLNEMFEIGFNKERLAKIASEIGSDVPFFIYNKPAKVTGFGEKIEVIENFSLGKKITLFVPKNITCDTKKVYEQFDKLNNYDFSQRNMLQEAAFAAYPKLKEKFEELRENFQGELFITGSGSCIVGLTEGEGFEAIEI